MIFILGLDGLDFDIVTRYDLKNLMQNDYSRLEVPINRKYGVPQSPEVWASFLTGTHIEQTFTRGGKTKIGTIAFNFLKFWRKRFNIKLGLSKKFWGPRFPKLSQKTFLDVLKAKEINAPYYSMDNTRFDILHQWFTGKISFKEFVLETKKLYAKRKQHVLHELESIANFDLIFVYMEFPDAYQHVFFSRPRRIVDHYIDLSKFVFGLKKNLPKDLLFIIVSDHGFDFKNASHSMHGFYSSNRMLDPKPKSITDFYNLLIELARKSVA